MLPSPLRAAAFVLAAGLLAGTLSAPAPASATAIGGPCRSGTVALTFDDGPASGPTDRLVRILRDAHVPATFFMVGQRVAANPVLARRVERAGLLVANHSWAHANMTTQSADQVAATLRATDRALRRAGTHPTRLMRPPYGALDGAARTGIRRAGMVPVLWTVDSRDWQSGTAGEIAARILAGLRPHARNIVLQHDGVRRSPISVDAVPIVVRQARRRGYCFTALDESGRPGFPTPRASVEVTDAVEGGHAVATVRLSKPPGRTTSVLLRTRSRTARVGTDLARIARRISIPAGRLSARVRIPVPREGTDEPTEEFAVTIGRPRGVRIGADTAVGRIADRDRPPLVRGQDLTVAEPETGSVTGQVVFRLSRASGKPTRVVLAARPGTADAADFTAARRVLDVAPGRTTVTFPVGVLADLVEEEPETFTVVVVRAARLRVGRSATVTIEPAAVP